MKKSKILALAMGAMMSANLFVPCMVSAEDGTETVTDSVPEVWYKFDDASVNGTQVSNSGSNTAVGAAEIKFGAEVLATEGDGSLYLAGGLRNTDSPHLEMPAGIAEGIDGDYTISLMVKGNNGAAYTGWALSLANGLGTENPFLFIAPYAEGTTFAFDNEGRNQAILNATGTEIAPVDEWSLLTLVYTAEDTTLTSYVNGVQNGQNTEVGEEYKLSEVFGAQEEGSANFLGKSAWWLNDPYFNGRVADFRLYSKAISEDELTELLAVKDAYNESSNAAEESDWVAVAMDKSELAIENADAITGDITLPETGTNGSTIVWSSSDEDIIAVDGTVTPIEEDTTVTLTAEITSGTVTETKSIECFVESSIPNPERIVGKDYEILDLGDLTAVTKNLTLPTEGANGSTITWSTTDETVVTETGEVNCDLEENKTAKLIATISYDEASLEKEFDVTVISALSVWYKFDAESINEAAGEKEVKNLGADSSVGAAKLENNAVVLNGAETLYLAGGGADGPRLAMPVGVAGTLKGDYTISVFVKKDTEDEGAVMAITNAPVGWPPRTPYLQLWLSSDTDATPRAEYNMYVSGGGDGRRILNGEKPENNVWNHLAITYSAETGAVIMYKNGEYMSEMTVTDVNIGEALANASMNYLGQDVGISKTLDGSMADFRIYSRELSETEVASIAVATEDYNAIDSNWDVLGETKATIDLGDLSAVREDLVLPTEGANGETITWSTDNAEVVTSEGVITKSKDSDLTATLTATITLGELTAVQAFDVTVKRDITESEAVALDSEWLAAYDFEAVKTTTIDDVSWTLPTDCLEAESTITWAIKDSVDGASISNNVLKVTRDAYVTKTVTLVATITNGEATETKEFTFTAEFNNLVKVYPVADADVRAEAPDTNYGSDGLTGMVSGDKIYMRFELPEIPANKVVEKVELKLTHTWGRSGATFSFSRVSNDAWDENVITYNNCPAVDAGDPIWNGYIGFNTGGGGANLRRYADLTSSVLAEADGVYSVCASVDEVDGAIRVCTKEESGDVSVYPMLVITLSDAEPAYSVDVNTEAEEPSVVVTKLNETGLNDMLVVAVKNADGTMKSVDVQTVDEIAWSEENTYDVSETAKALAEGEMLQVFVWTPGMVSWTNVAEFTK